MTVDLPAWVDPETGETHRPRMGECVWSKTLFWGDDTFDGKTPKGGHVLDGHVVWGVEYLTVGVHHGRLWHSWLRGDDIDWDASCNGIHPKALTQLGELISKEMIATKHYSMGNWLIIIEGILATNTPRLRTVR